MKKGMKGDALKHKLSPMKQSGFIASVIAFITVAVVSLGTFVFNLIALCAYPTQSGDFIKDLGNVIISALSFVISALGSYRSINKLFQNSFNRHLIEDPAYKNEIIQTVGNNIDEQYEESEYVWGEYDEARYLYSEKVDQALARMFPAKINGKADGTESDLLLKISPKIQPLSSEQSEALYRNVTKKRMSGKNIFNSQLVRLRTDLLLNEVLSEENAEKTKNLKADYKENAKIRLKFTDVKLIEVEKTDYYSNITSNDLIYSRLFAYDHSSIFYGKDMTVNSNKVLYNLSHSPASNIIGVTTLAITKDGKLVINKQDNNNDVNNDCYVPSGSGSADFNDFKACRKLEKKTKTVTYAEKLKKLKKSYASLNLKNNRDTYKKTVKNKLNDFKSLETVDENNFDKRFKTDKETYENGIKAKKELKQLKRYCKTLNKYTCSFKNFITYGMVRELVEESHVCDTVKHKIPPSLMKDFMDRTEICGYIRILDRGGKPDFFGITYLNCNEKELKEKFFRVGLKVAEKELKKHSAITDFSEICSQIYIPCEKLLTCESFEELFPITFDNDTGKPKKPKISLQLYYLLTTLKNKLSAEKAEQCEERKQDKN